MRNALGMAALMAALSFGSGQALAFQETPAPPPAEVPQAQTADTLALQLGTPNAVPAAPKAESGGLNLFGYSVLPKLISASMSCTAKTSSNCSWVAATISIRSTRTAT